MKSASSIDTVLDPIFLNIFGIVVAFYQLNFYNTLFRPQVNL